MGIMELLAFADKLAQSNPETIVLFLFTALFYCLFKKEKNAVIKFINTNFHAPLDIRESARLSSLINDTLVQLVILTGADRVSLFQYHNGCQNLMNVPFAKASVTNEVCNIGITPLFELNQNIPIGMLSWWVTSVLDHTIEIEKVDDIFLEDRGVYEFLKSRESKSVYAICLKDFKDNPIGFVLMEFIKAHKTIDSNVFIKCKEISNQISGYFLGEKYYASK